jgi:WD40 repeat protein
MPELGKMQLRQRRILKGHLGKITSVKWFADSQKLVSVAQDGKMMIWDGPSTNKLQVINLCSTWVMNVGVSPSGKLTASGGLDNVVSVFDLKAAEAETSRMPKGSLHENRPMKELQGHTGFISCVRFLGDKEILSASGDQTCVLWDLETGRQKTVFAGHNADVMEIALMTDSSGHANTFVSASGDCTARLWDFRTGSCVGLFEGHDSDLSCVDVAPEGQSFVTGSDDATCRLWDIRSDNMLMTYGPVRVGGEAMPLTSVGFSHSGRGIFASYEEASIRLWDTFNGSCKTVIKTTDKDADRVSRLAVSTDGNGLATACWDGIIKIWA